jgi:hypothetical protein
VLLTSTTPTLASTFPGGVTATVVVAGAVVLAVILGVLAFLDRSTPVWALGLVALLEIGLLVVTAIGVIAWIGGDAPAEPVVFFFYLLACLAIPPLGRWGSGVVAIACLVLAVLVLRVEQVWSGTGGGIAP